MFTACDGPASPHVTAFDASTSAFSLTLRDAAGTAVTTYRPGHAYAFVLAPADNATRYVGGFIAAAFQGTRARIGTTAFTRSLPVGALVPSDDLSQAMVNDYAGHDCSVACITHTGSGRKAAVRATWTAPRAGTGAVTLFAIVVEVRGRGR